LQTLKLVTIISDDALTQNLIDDVKRLGAKGYTMEVGLFCCIGEKNLYKIPRVGEKVSKN
jgi:hypothetical protein